MSDNPLNPLPRGSFPKVPHVETVAQRRDRYERWVLNTRGAQPDHELHAIRFYRGQTTMVPVAPGSAERKEVPKAPSPVLCVAARCRQCEGADDPGVAERIGACGNRRCDLLAVRPHQQRPQQSGRAASRAAIKRYCLACARGSSTEVKLCHAATCALWPIRPFQRAEPDHSGADDAPDAQTEGPEGER